MGTSDTSTETQPTVYTGGSVLDGPSSLPVEGVERRRPGRRRVRTCPVSHGGDFDDCPEQSVPNCPLNK